jgi:HTH-type transcriptional regulator/antitoxin MqsA
MPDIVSTETGAALKRGCKTIELSYKGRTAKVQVEGWYGETADDGVVSTADMRPLTRALNRLKAEADNLTTPDEIARIRRKLKLSQRDASALLGGGPNAFAKYETGDVLVSRAMSNLLRLLASDGSLLDKLRKASASKAA